MSPFTFCSIEPLRSTGLIDDLGLLNFGGNVEIYSRDFQYEGVLLLLSSNVRIIERFSIRCVHVYGRGWCWAFDPSVNIPAPFLITDDLAMRIVFDGAVHFEPNDKLKTLFAHYPNHRHIPLYGNTWAGALTWRRPGWLRRKRSFHLLAFADSEKADHQFTGPVVTNEEFGGTLSMP